MDLIKSGTYMYIDIFMPKHVQQQKNKHSGRVSCSACNAFKFYCNFKDFLSMFAIAKSLCFYAPNFRGLHVGLGLSVRAHKMNMTPCP